MRTQDDTSDSSFPEGILQKIRATQIVAVVVIEEANQAIPLMESLLRGGIRALELALRTEASLEAAGLIRNRFDEVILGLGTVLTPGQVQQCVDVGADFAVAPGTSPAVIDKARELGLPFAPGIATPTDIETAVSHGCRFLKFFPAEPIGGLMYLKSMTNPYAHLGLEYIPLGGLNDGNFTQYLSEPNIPAVGGSWIAPRNLIQSGNWEEIERNAKAANEILKQANR